MSAVAVLRVGEECLELPVLGGPRAPLRGQGPAVREHVVDGAVDLVPVQGPVRLGLADAKPRAPELRTTRDPLAYSQHYAPLKTPAETT